MIYLDYSATTKPDEKVIEVYNKVAREYYANSNSLHSLGIKSKELEEYATNKIAKLLKVKPTEIIYTSGASESNNQALKGICFKYKKRANHIITTKLEHSSITETVKYLTENGFVVDYVNILENGEVDLEHLKQLINDNTLLVSICAVDSELGIKQPIEKISQIVKCYPKCYFHVDCTQAIGKINIDLSQVDLASISAHKIYGFKGIGLLYKKESIAIDPLIHGGKSTTIYRSGTPALPLIVSMMKALELIIPKVEENYNKVKILNNLVKDNFTKYPKVHINSTEKSIPYVINFSIKDIKPETFVHALDEKNIYISTKSACSKANTMSESVYSVTKNKDYASTSLRISLSYLTTEKEIEEFTKAFDECYKKLTLK
jgi:cysteine desulfurase